MHRATALASAFLLTACAHDPVDQLRTVSTPEALEKHCVEHIGGPTVESPAKGVFVARGYDLANTIVIQTPEGNVVVDPGMTVGRAKAMRAALEKQAPGKTLALVLTHSHIDHVGGASVWMDEGTEVWATDSFARNFMKQYGDFRTLEGARAQRQFGARLPDEAIPCSALGLRVDFEGLGELGVRLPTKTIGDGVELDFGGVTVVLRPAPGETTDELMVWLPKTRALLPGDNLYTAYPNLYTIRGTERRPVGDWVKSLDAMRALDPAVLVPSHTEPVIGEAAVREVLRNYRDGIAWVLAHVVREANRGVPLDTIVETAGLPPHLAGLPHLAERYGQVDWSARAIYVNHLGWFDGDPEDLYPMPMKEAARREVDLMGGEKRVLDEAKTALDHDDARWALNLLARLRVAGVEAGEHADPWRTAWVRALTRVGETVGNSNGRSYLLMSALEAETGPEPLPPPVLDEAMVASLPIETFFEALPARLFPEQAMDVTASVVVDLEGDRWVITVRRGIAEVVRGTPLPGTPEPLATAKTTARTWKRIALGLDSPAGAVAGGDLDIEGGVLTFKGFMDRFRKGP